MEMFHLGMFSSVTEMGGMFGYSVFNQDISSWDVSNVTRMIGMFLESSFNGDISNWDVSSVTDMRSMFKQISIQWRYFILGCFECYKNEQNV